MAFPFDKFRGGEGPVRLLPWRLGVESVPYHARTVGVARRGSTSSVAAEVAAPRGSSYLDGTELGARRSIRYDTLGVTARRYRPTPPANGGRAVAVTYNLYGGQGQGDKDKDKAQASRVRTCGQRGAAIRRYPGRLHMVAWWRVLDSAIARRGSG